MNKREVCKLPVLTFLVIRWNDAHDSLGILADKPVYRKGDMSFKVLCKDGLLRYVVSTQIVATCESVVWPFLTLDVCGKLVSIRPQLPSGK